MADITFEIKESIGVLSESTRGWAEVTTKGPA